MGDLNPGDFTAVQIQRLCLAKDPDQTDRALKLLSPNREVNPEFTAYIVTRKDGSSVVGLISLKNSTGIAITRADGQVENILRSDIEEVAASRLFLMPDGLEAAFDHQGMADLLS
jgi:putative heme-binding domain-containing protein